MKVTNYNTRDTLRESITFRSGIDAFNIQSLLFQSDEIREHKKLLRERFGEHMKLIVSRDHCDRISGLMTKLLSYELFLKDNPDYIGLVSLIQVCPGKILDDDLNRQLILIIDRINSLYKQHRNFTPSGISSSNSGS